ncbi:hypothetical protein Tco_0164605 [Tanacetum coccineum]
MGLWYPTDSGFELTTFSDANHTGCLDTRKITSGGIQFLGEKLVSWMLKKQDCSAMSTAQAEDVVLSASCVQVGRGIIELYFVINEYQLVDLFTKALSQDTFEYLVKRLVTMEILPVTTSNSTAVGSYALRWKPYQGDSSKLNLPDHRYQDYQDKDYQGRLLASFQDDAKYEHVGQDTRSQGGKDLKEKDLKISKLKTKLKDNDKSSRSKITQHERTSLQQG